jgi:hypothetical protein
VATGHFMILLGQRLASCCHSFWKVNLPTRSSPSQVKFWTWYATKADATAILERKIVHYAAEDKLHMVQSAWSLDLCEFENFFRYADSRDFSSIRLHIRHSQYPGAEDYILVCYLVSMRSEKKCYYTRDCVVPSAGFSA